MTDTQNLTGTVDVKTQDNIREMVGLDEAYPPMCVNVPNVRESPNYHNNIRLQSKVMLRQLDWCMMNQAGVDSLT